MKKVLEHMTKGEERYLDAAVTKVIDWMVVNGHKEFLVMHSVANKHVFTVIQVHDHVPLKYRDLQWKTKRAAA